MSDRPYTDDDLRALAARVHAAAARDSDDRVASAVKRQWGAQLDIDQTDEAGDALITILDRAADTSRWAIHLGADDLQPSDEHVITLDGDGKPIARIHFAFEPDMPDDMRTALVEGIGEAINAHL